MKLKNKLKTVVSTAIAMSIGTTMLPLSVSAELSEPAEPNASVKYYDSRDINRDGKIEITDVVLFNRCMVGAEYISDFKQLDADTNGIINFADAQCIMAKLVGSSYSCSVDGLWSYTSQVVSDTPSPIFNTKSAKYVKYNYKAQKISGEYTLSMPKEYNAENAISTYGVIGDDDREYMKNQSEFSGIIGVELGIKKSSNENSRWYSAGTGFIVGDHQIATAAHCVYGTYDESDDEYHFYSYVDSSKNRLFLYDENGNKTGEMLTPVEVHIPSDYIEKSQIGEEVIYYDYALITVEEDLSKYTHFNMGLVKEPYSSTFLNANIYVSGLPDIVNSTKNENNKIAKGCGKMYTGSKVHPNEILYYTTDTSDGDSGAPVYTTTKYKVGNTEYYDYTAIGIVSGTVGIYNYGVRVIPLIQRFYNSNPNFSY
ncbi:MAG: trypsin-like peptidase domain-containing protein [Oscillospiraceae bacterium]|nr:trypsin-like peptidase domain-containing protein [Oscillospiraceae bacterium]